jgi:hypothetical protein
MQKLDGAHGLISQALSFKALSYAEHGTAAYKFDPAALFRPFPQPRNRYARKPTAND